MSKTVTALMASGVVAAGMVFASAASAAPVVNPLTLKIAAAQGSAALPNVETVRWRGGGGWRGGGWRGGSRGWRGGGRGWGYGGLAAGAIIGGALASGYYGPYGYGYGSYYAPAPPPDYYGDEVEVGGGDVAYCMQRFKSYNPRSGTYLGYDGARHPCP